METQGSSSLIHKIKHYKNAVFLQGLYVRLFLGQVWSLPEGPTGSLASSRWWQDDKIVAQWQDNAPSLHPLSQKSLHITDCSIHSNQRSFLEAWQSKTFLLLKSASNYSNTNTLTETPHFWWWDWLFTALLSKKIRFVQEPWCYKVLTTRPEM